MEMMLAMQKDPEVFLIAAKIRCQTERHCFEDSVAGVQAANIGKMMSIGIGKKYYMKQNMFFPDFTHMDMSFIEGLINTR
jgi:beta-phosphoglucomutase